MTPKADVYQIFYDTKSQGTLDPGFLPLDNSLNSENDWYEFSAIRGFLKTHELEEDRFYGFVSPRFRHKTGMDSAMLKSEIAKAPRDTDVILVSSHLRNLAAHWNVFIQGELGHPGLMRVMTEFCTAAKLDADLANAVSHIHNAVYSNYVIAKPVYWRSWLVLADLLYEIASSGDGALSRALNAETTYGQRRVAMKVFVQERLHALMLRGSWHVFVPDWVRSFRFGRGPSRMLFIWADLLKQKHEQSQKRIYRDVYDYVALPLMSAEINYRKARKRHKKKLRK
jgi:hypothetical protein